MADSSAIEAVFRRSERRLWGLCYRMTGVAADADDLVQETFVRAIEGPASLRDLDLERWLVRVATNLSLDCLRRRKRRAYSGPWLPSPMDTPEATTLSASVTAWAEGTELSVERAEQVSYAFLVALEALGPRARAALLLVELLDYSTAEVASILDTTEGNVRVLHHRAQRALESYDIERVASPTVQARQRVALERFLDCMQRQDAEGIQGLLADDVRSITDGGGRYTALREPLVGKAQVARFHLETARRRAPISHMELRSINGSAALVVVTRPLRPQMAPRLVLRCEVDADGRIREIHTILNPLKLTAVNFGDSAAESSAIAR